MSICTQNQSKVFFFFLMDDYTTQHVKRAYQKNEKLKCNCLLLEHGMFFLRAIEPLFPQKCVVYAEHCVLGIF